MVQQVKINKVGSLFAIQLDRPAVLNALSFEMLLELKTHLIHAFTDVDVKTIWLESTQQKAFCVGGDVKALALEIDSFALDIEKSTLGLKYFELEYGVDLLIENSPKPIVAFSQGMTFGGGWGLFAGANLRLCDANASFSMPENQIGFFPDVGAAAFLQKNQRKLGAFLGISGIRLSAYDAIALGFVDKIISSNYAQILKSQLSKGLNVSELDIECELENIDGIYAQWQEGIALLPEDSALIDWLSIVERNVNFEPFVKAKKCWLTASPWSIAFTWEYFRMHRDSSRQQVLEKDSQVGAYFCTHPEFYEGVHTKLIHKTGTPKWMYSHVESVPMDAINKAIAN